MRIAILGGGAAGIFAALCLEQRGYQDITILERDSRIGGKCYSPLFHGRNYDAGGDYVTPIYRDVIKYAQELNRELVSVPKRIMLDVETGKYFHPTRAVFRDVNPVKFAAAAAHYIYLAGKYRSLSRPGWTDIPADLCMPFGEWLKKHGLEELKPIFSIPLQVFGYAADFNDIAAAYVLKFVNLEHFVLLTAMLSGAKSPWPKRFRYGFEPFLEELANRFDVRLDVEVESIARDGGVTIATKASGEEKFDALIVACPVGPLLKVMDCDDTEQYLFSRVLSNHYYTTIYQCNPMPSGFDVHGTVDPIPETCGKRHPWAMVRMWSDTNTLVSFSLDKVAVSYGSKESKSAAKEIVRNIEADVQIGGGALEKVLAQYFWDYFPHVSSEDLLDGYFDRFEQQQGEHNTYYVWSLLNFETVHHATQYSKYIVNRYF